MNRAPSRQSDPRRSSPRRSGPRRAACAAALAALALVGAGGVRLAADLTDLPADDAARALQAQGDYAAAAPGLVLATRRASLRLHPTPERHFAIGRALMASADPKAGEAAAAFAAGLALAPGRGTVWAEYGRALMANGETERGLAAYEMSKRRAPDDPLARRIRVEQDP